VKSHLAIIRDASFDATACYTRVAEEIHVEDVSGAEKILDREVHRFPREVQLRRYLSIVSRARLEISAAPDRREEVLSWLKMIASARCRDRDSYKQELNRAVRDLPDCEVARLLQASERQV
jgi:hypothetical protein